MGEVMKKVAILFGGNSFEHEVSIKSATSIIDNIDKNKYDITLIYITKDNIWYLFNDDISKINDLSNCNIIKIDNIIDKLNDVDTVFNIIHGNTSEDGKLQGLFDLFNIRI